MTVSWRFIKLNKLVNQTHYNLLKILPLLLKQAIMNCVNFIYFKICFNFCPVLHVHLFPVCFLSSSDHKQKLCNL